MSTSTTETADAAAEREKRDKALKEAYVAATKRLRDQHQDEFNGYRQLEAAERGYEWKPRSSPEEKAAAELQRLIAEFPHLVNQVTAAPVPQTEVEDGPTSI